MHSVSLYDAVCHAVTQQVGSFQMLSKDVATVLLEFPASRSLN
jgi:hypothetical protein